MKRTQAIKERLNAHRDMLEKLEALKLELEYAEEQYGACKAPSFSGMPGGGGHTGKSETEVKVGRKIEIEEHVKRMQTKIDRDWDELEPMVENLKPIETLVVNLRYRYGGEWDAVCFAVFGRRKDYELELDRYMNKTFKIHGRALLSLSEMNDQTETEEDAKL